MGEADSAVSVVGLGKLGAPMVACFASRGKKVIGVDRDERVVRLVGEGRAPVFEPGLEERLRAHRGDISATADFGRAVAGSGATFIVVPTPSDDSGGFDARHAVAAAREIGGALRRKKDWHLVVMTSTVLPGTTEREIIPALEESSGKRCGRDFGLCYSPEFIALGSVIRDFLNPDFVLIGESDGRAGERLAGLYREVCENEPAVARMNIVNAELTKIAVNTFVTTKISYANMLAEICERLPGADVDTVTGALGLDSRIGRKYLKGALGYGGPCFPRDNAAFAALAGRIGAGSALARATDEVNRRQVARVAELVLRERGAGQAVGILGLSYKPDTNVVEESQGIMLAREFLGRGVPVVLHDPAALENARRVLGDKPAYAGSLADCLDRSGILVLMTPWGEYRELARLLAGRKGGPLTIVDCWRIVNPAELGPDVTYRAVGRGQPVKGEG